MNKNNNKIKLKFLRKIIYTLSNLLPFGVIILDKNNIVRKINLRGTKLLGYNPSEIIGHHINKMPFLQKINRSIIEDLLNNPPTNEENLENIEMELIKQDGELLPTTISIVSSSIDNIIAFKLIIFREIKEYRLYKQLQEFKAKYDLIFENAAEAMIITDFNGIIINCNKNSEKLIDFSRNEFANNSINILQIFSQESHLKLVSAIEQTITGNPSKALNLRIVKKDGSDSYVDAFCNSFKVDENFYLLITLKDITNQIKIIEELELAKQQYELLITNQGEGIAIIDLEEKLIFVNPAAEKIFGMPKASLINKCLLDFIIPEHKDIIKQQARQRLAGIKSVYEICIKRMDGELRWILITATPYFDKKGNVVGTFAIFRDDTERKKIEEELRLEKELNQQYFDIAGVILIVLDSKGVVKSINKKGCQVLEYEKNEIIGKNWFYNFLPHEIRTDVMNVFRSLINGQVSNYEYYENHVLTKSGKRRLIKWHNEILLDEKGKVVGTISSGEDITEQRKAEQSLRESEEKFRIMTSQAKDAIIMIDNNGCATFWNEAAEKIFGYKADEVIGKELHTLICPPEFYPAYKMSFDKFRKTGFGNAIGKTIELKAIRKDKTEFPVEISVSGVKIQNCWHAIGIIRDITERKIVENELIKAREAALQASKAKSAFLASMSHEIRTPMNAIIGMADLLSEANLEPEYKQYVKVLQNAGDNLLSLINDILDLSKIESGHLELEQIEFSIIELVERVVETLAIKAHSKKLELLYELSDDIPDTLIGDPVRLRQILINLIGNAIKFTEKGEITLRANVENTDDSSCTLLFEVSDTGIGIPEEKQQYIFEPFIQVDSSTTRKYGGTGLGLSISKSLCEMMGGKIWVKSKLNEGSSFYFTATFKSIQTSAPKQIPITMSGKKILIIDDTDSNRKILKKYLQKYGLITSEANDLNTALQLINRNHFDLILIDYNMDNTCGADIAIEIKKYLPKITPILFMINTNHKNEDISRIKKLTEYNFFLKPVKYTEMFKALSLIFQEKQVQVTETAESKTAQINRPINLLLVEDNADNRLLIQSYLKKYPIKIDIAENGEIAVAKFKENKYDIVLMDMQMPVMDGYTATSLIRQWEKEQNLPPTPLIALTAYALKEDIEKSINIGCTNHLSKPIKKDKLIQFIFKYIKEEKNE
jgi:PAS domain S-box-containing protein